MSRYVVTDRHGRVASIARVGIDWLPPRRFDAANFLKWETHAGALRFAGMNGGTVTPIADVDGAVKHTCATL